MPRLLLILLLGLSAPFGLSAGPAEQVRITNGEWPPFTSQKLPQGGMLTRLVTEIFAEAGITVTYDYLPWKRAYAVARNGEADGSVGWAPTADHLNDFYMSDPVLVVDKGLFHLRETAFAWTRIEDLSAWRLGAASGYSYGPEFDKARNAGILKVEEVPTDEQNIRKLLAGHLQVVAMETEVAHHLLSLPPYRDRATQVLCSPKLLEQTPICLCLSRKNPGNAALIARFNLGLAKLKADGRLRRYQDETHLKHWGADKD